MGKLPSWMRVPKWLHGDNLQLVLTLISMVVAIVIGMCAAPAHAHLCTGVCVATQTIVPRKPHASPNVIFALGLPGQLFVNALKMVILPLMCVHVHAMCAYA
jgi:hypothetical protein